MTGATDGGGVETNGAGAETVVAETGVETAGGADASGGRTWTS